MTTPAVLIPLTCIQCSTPVPANPGEIAWACQTCGTGMILDEDSGLQPFTINYSDALKPGSVGRPFWVATGTVSMDRSTYGLGSKDKDARKFWEQPRQFFIPAFSTTIDEMVELGAFLLRNGHPLQPADPSPFQPVVQKPDDMTAMAEFIVVGIEAERRDDIKKLAYTLQLEEPSLWVLP